MSVYGSMSQSNLEYLISIITRNPVCGLISEFGEWDSAAFFIANSSIPSAPTFRIVPLLGIAPLMQVVPTVVLVESSPVFLPSPSDVSVGVIMGDLFNSR